MKIWGGQKLFPYRVITILPFTADPFDASLATLAGSLASFNIGLVPCELWLRHRIASHRITAGFSVLGSYAGSFICST